MKKLMKRIIFANRTGSFVSLAVVSLLLAGCCMLSAKYRTDEAIGRESVLKIRCGETTLEDVVKQFGPPLVIARKGKNTIYSTPRQATVRFVERSSQPFLELFSKDRPVSDNEAVYYYRATKRDKTGFLLFLLLINIGETINEVQTEHLWLLVDEQTGVVEDVEYRDRDRYRTGCANAPVSGSGEMR
jgi:hypothetical protein